MKVVLGYPTPHEEFEIVNRMGVTPPVSKEVLSLEGVQALQKIASTAYWVIAALLNTPSISSSPPELQKTTEWLTCPSSSLAQAPGLDWPCQGGPGNGTTSRPRLRGSPRHLRCRSRKLCDTGSC